MRSFLAPLWLFLSCLAGSWPGLAVAQSDPPPVDSPPEEPADATEPADSDPTPSPEATPEPTGVPEASPEPSVGLEEPPPNGNRRLAVLILATPGVEPATADALTELAIGALVARGGVSIVGKEEFQALLGQGEERSIECVSSSACLGRIGVQLNVDELVAGTLGRRGNVWVFNLNRIEIRSGELVGRVFREVEGDLGAVADAVQSAVPELFEVGQEPADLRIYVNVEGAEVALDGVLLAVFRGEPVLIPDLRPGRHSLRVSMPGYFDWERTINVASGTTLQVDVSLEEADTAVSTQTSPLVWVGAGVAVAGLGTGIVFGLMSQSESAGDGSRRDAESNISDRETQATVANVGFGVAGAGALTYLLGLLLSDFSSAEEGVTAGYQDGPRLSWRGAF